MSDYPSAPVGHGRRDPSRLRVRAVPMSRHRLGSSERGQPGSARRHGAAPSRIRWSAPATSAFALQGCDGRPGSRAPSGRRLASGSRARRAYRRPGRTPVRAYAGPQLAAFIRTLHETRGVVFHLGRLRAESSGATWYGETANASRWTSWWPASALAWPSRLAETAGLSVDRGIVVDRYLETSRKRIVRSATLRAGPTFEARTRAHRTLGPRAAAGSRGGPGHRRSEDPCRTSGSSGASTTTC
jgi:hypothetical protein